MQTCCSSNAIDKGPLEKLRATHGRYGEAERRQCWGRHTAANNAHKGLLTMLPKRKLLYCKQHLGLSPTHVCLTQRPPSIHTSNAAAIMLTQHAEAQPSLRRATKVHVQCCQPNTCNGDCHAQHSCINTKHARLNTPQHTQQLMRICCAKKRPGTQNMPACNTASK
jgi:hypothetical protein